MKTREEIMKAAMKENEVPDGYNLIEQNCFYVIKQLLIMFRNGEISQESASRNKEKVFKQYEEEINKYGFMIDLYKKHTQDILKTENDRIKLHKMLNTDSEINDMFNVSMSIIDSVFEGEFSMGGKI